MKNTYSGLLAGLLLAAATPATAYNFHPFHPGWTYQYSQSATPGDTAVTVRMDRRAVPIVALPDSLYPLRGRTIVAMPRNATGPCGQATRRLSSDGPFGMQMLVRDAGFARAQYVLRAFSGRTFTLQPRAALNQPWAAAPGITARVTARGVATVLGQPDSVVTIALSDGQVLRIGKETGYLNGPALDHYLRGDRPARYLTLTALNGRGVPVIGPRGMFNFQENDVFLRYSKQLSTWGVLCSESWTRDSIVTRTSFADSVVYKIWGRTLNKTYGMANPPQGYCWGTTGATLSAGREYKLVVTDTKPQEVAALSGTVTPFFNNWGTLAFPGIRKAAEYNGRHQLRLLSQDMLSGNLADSTCLRNIIDHITDATYVAGLGLVRHETIDYADVTSSTTLVGYLKNTPTGPEAWGQLRSFRQLLSVAGPRPLSATAASPNPFTDELTINFELTRAAAVRLDVRDALGRMVLALPAAAYAAGPGRVTLAAAHLPAGLYTVQLRVGDAAAQVLKVVKTQQ